MGMENHASRPSAGRRLPPLILHPFSDANAPERLASSARASLVLHGLLAAGELTADQLKQKLLDGRYAEVRMLYYVGKDVSRWLDQCVDAAGRDDELRRRGIERESFAVLLIEDPPSAVREKMQRWGVVDYQTIFRRALGLHAVFSALPEREHLSDIFLEHHHRFTDMLYQCRRRNAPSSPVIGQEFHFEIYASGEYARLLEQEWSSD